MIDRDGHIRALRRLFSNNSVIVLLGPRGAGKTTLSRDFAQRSRSNSYFFDLASAADRSRLDDPALALSNLQGLVVLDEIHRAPHILDAVRQLLLRPWNPARFLVLSSIFPDKLRQRFETISEFTSRYELPRSSVLGTSRTTQASLLWLRGGLPASYGAGSDSESYEWRERYVRDFVERDIHRLTSNAPERPDRAIPDHAGALPCAGVERIGTGALAGRLASHGPPLSEYS